MSQLSVQFEQRLTRVELINASDVEARGDSLSPRPKTAKADSLKLLLDKIASELEAIKAQQQQHIGQLNATSVQLASIIVERLIGKSDVLKTERLHELVAEALAGAESPISIRINPADLSALKKSSNQPLDQLVPDESVSQGECICDFSGYQMLSDFNQQLESIADRLLEVIHD